jgi:hypothetical protein
MTTSFKTHIGKEDIELQTNKTTTPETFSRTTTTGGIITLTKIPDIWDGTGCVNCGKILVRAADDGTTILHAFGDIT